MAKSKNAAGFLSALVTIGLYKRNQGRLVRQLTAVGLIAVVVLGTFTMSQSFLSDFHNSYHVVSLSYPGNETDSIVVESVHQLASRFGGEAQALDPAADSQSIEVSFSKSRFGISKSKAATDAIEQDASEFSAAVIENHKQMTVSPSNERTVNAVLIPLGIPILLALAGGWVVYRAVNFPQFADFLISVEAEMDKVTWSTKPELYRATVVVLVTMVLLGVILFVFDVFWQNFFEWINFLEVTGA